MPKRVEVGIVTSDKMKKTRRVEIARLVKHPKYGKYLRRRTVCYVHDEDNQSRAGDTVEIIESRPMSRKKRWQLVRVVSKSRLAGMAALPGPELLEAGQEGLGMGDEGRGTRDEGLGIGD
jgi:small subunit ribosomal protein S17